MRLLRRTRGGAHVGCPQVHRAVFIGCVRSVRSRSIAALRGDLCRGEAAGEVRSRGAPQELPRRYPPGRGKPALRGGAARSPAGPVRPPRGLEGPEGVRGARRGRLHPGIPRQAPGAAQQPRRRSLPQCALGRGPGRRGARRLRRDPRRRHPAAQGRGLGHAEEASRGEPRRRGQPALRDRAADQPAEPFHRDRDLGEPGSLRRARHGPARARIPRQARTDERGAVRRAPVRNRQLSGNDEAHRRCLACSPAGRRRAVERAARKPALPVEVGRGRRARLGQPHEEPRGRAARRAAHQDRRGDRAEPRARARHGLLRHAHLQPAHQAHLHEHRQEHARQQRGGRHLRDRPGRHAVRRLRAPEPWRFALQLLQDQRDGDALRLHQARRAERADVLRARRADRRCRPEGRRDARRHLRDHRRRSAAGPAAGKPQAAAGRRGHHPYRLGQALRQGQRALREEHPGRGRRRGRVAGEAGPAARRLRQLAGGSGAEPRQGPEPAGAPDLPGGERHPHPGKPEARRAGREARLRVRVHDAAAQDLRRLGLERRAGRNPLDKEHSMSEEGLDRRTFLKSAAAISTSIAAASTVAAETTKKSSTGLPGEKIIGRPGSDFMVDVIKATGIEYIASNPASSFRSLHESIVNYGGNRKPEFLTCMHEESSVAMAHGYAKAAGKPMGVLAHGSVGLQHAAMAVYNAWCDRVPVMLFGGNFMDAAHRRPGVEWYHCVQDPAGMLRDFVKWDDQPASLQHFAEALNAPVVDLGSRMNFPTTHYLCRSEDGRALIREADAVLMLEVADPWGQLNTISDPQHEYRRIAKPDVKLIHVTLADNLMKSNYQDAQRFCPCDLSISGDAEATLPALTEAVKKEIGGSRKSALAGRTDKLRSQHREMKERTRAAAANGWNAVPVTTARLSAELWNAIKGDKWCLADSRNLGWSARLWPATEHYNFLGHSGAAGVGQIAPAAVGAALANRDKGILTAVIQPDGDLMYAPGVLWTAAHHKIPILMLMHNNRAYHQEVMHLQKMAGLHNRRMDTARIGTTIENPHIDYALLARAQGVWAEGPITDPAAIAPALQRAVAAVKRGEPALVDVVTQGR